MSGPAPERVFVALGSNLGDRAAMLEQARAGLEAIPATAVVAVSSVLETEPLGPPGQDNYLNQMVELRTSLDPLELLNHLQALELRLGRIREERWGPRVIDLDIIRFGDRAIDTPRLTVPHPEIARRHFWVEHLRELEADGG